MLTLLLLHKPSSLNVLFMQAGEKIVITEQDFRRRFVYDQSSLLGEGGFAKVYKAYDRQFDETVALKFYTKTDVHKYDIISEMRNSRRFTHKNIIRVHDARIVRFTNRFGMEEDVQVGILEFADAGNLQNFLRSSPSEDEFKQVMLEILQGLHYLHTEKRVIHRDLSPDNILMVKEGNRWTPKIADFGISKQIDMKTINLGDKKVSSELVGKMEYMAPEQFDPKKYGINGQITTNVDLWSFGIIVTEIFAGYSPFGDRNTAQSPMQIMHNVLYTPLPAEIKSIPEPYRQLIRQCLVKDANKRVKSSLELINLLTETRQKKNKSGSVMLISVFSILFAAGVLFTLFQFQQKTTDTQLGEASQTNTRKPEIDTPTQTKDTLEQPPKYKDSVQNEAGSGDKHKESDVPETSSPYKPPPQKKNPNSLQNPEGREGVSNDTQSDKSDNGPTEKEDTASVPKPGNGIEPKVGSKTPNESQKMKLLKELHDEIVFLNDKDTISAVRMSKISLIISKFFYSGKESIVEVKENDGIQGHTIENFFKYVVNTSNDEVRSWEIDYRGTKLTNGRISKLALEKKVGIPQRLINH